MTNPPVSKVYRLTGYRWQILAAMMGVVAALTGIALYLVERSLVNNAERELQLDFQNQLAALHNVQELRHVALAERCHALVRKPRIHAALEDNALDLLYPSAQDELRDVMSDQGDQSAPSFHSVFYRFIDRKGAVIPAKVFPSAGSLSSSEEKQLELSRVPERQEVGYILRNIDGREEVVEVIVMPIVSSETGEVIAALALGFRPFEFAARTARNLESGIFLNGRLYLASQKTAEADGLKDAVASAVGKGDQSGQRTRVLVGASSQLLFQKRINPGSDFPAAYEVCSYSLDSVNIRLRRVRFEVIATGMSFLLCGLVVSHFISGRLSRPVEKLAVESAENESQRARAEAALETTNEELQRSVRFSADASHQLKTPVAVLRAGLEELLARENLDHGECEEISALIHQTYRLSSLIDDLLLLSRMDAGRLRLELAPVNLTRLIEASLDDLEASPDNRVVEVKTDFPPALQIEGEKRFTAIVLQNLLENARKYNRPGGHISITASEADGWISVLIGNTGSTIPAAAQAHIFERFHRGSVGENVPGYGLGLNLARELMRLHNGDLRLIKSADGWTEFEARFRPVQEAPAI